MAKSIRTDVLIAGAGPAGTAAAMSILHYSSLKVAIVENSSFENLKVGEQVSSSIFDILAYIGIKREDFDKDCFLDGYGSMAAWGSENMRSRHSIFSLNGQSYQLDREKFDLHLVERAAQAGAQIMPRSRVKLLGQTSDGKWNVKIEHETQGEILLHSRYLIDATGRQSSISRQLGINTVKADSLVGVGTFATFHSDQQLMQEIYLETMSEGWWYCSALPNARVNITFFTDADIAKNLQLQKNENWNYLLSQTKHIKKLLRNANAEGQLWIRNAFSQVVESYQRQNFLAIGDAAVSFDPISSMGIGFALTSGCNGARTLIDFNNGHQSAILTYRNDLKAIYNQFLEQKCEFYRKEFRWKDAPFWMRRHSLPLENRWNKETTFFAVQ
ncbi:lysine-epsilon-oxidase maturase LodB [Emticicia fontis]